MAGEDDNKALIETFKMLGKTQAEATAEAKKYGEALKNVNGISLGTVTGEVHKLSKLLKDQVPNFTALSMGAEKFGTTGAAAFKGITFAMSNLLTMGTNFNAFQNLEVKGGNSIKTLGSDFDDLVVRFGGWANASKALVGTSLSHLVGKTEEVAKKFLDNASSAQKLEASYINLMQASGQLGKVFDTTGNISVHLKDNVAEYGAHLNDVAAISHVSLKAASELSAELSKFPGVMGTNIEMTGASSDKLKIEAAAFRLAAGAGKDVHEVVAALSTAYDYLGNSTGKVIDVEKKSIELFALMSETQQKLGLRFEDTQGYLTHVAQQFQNVGDNTLGSIHVLERFQGALQNTGLTARASTAIVTHMVDSIKGLEMGTKALISARSGGAGGLQGAFQVENLLNQGKIDEVAKMMEQTLRKQFGGRIYTREEAAQSPQAAAQFMRQRTMLQSGAFGGIAKDADTASKLLEAMKSGPVATENAIKGGLEAVKLVNTQGIAKQDLQINEIGKLNSGLDRSITIQQQTYLATARMAIGIGADKTGAVAQDLKKFIEVAQSKEVERVGQAKGFEGKPNEIGSFEEENQRAVHDTMTSIGSIGKMAAEGVKTVVHGASAALNISQKDAAKQADIKRAIAEQHKSQEAQAAGERARKTMQTATQQHIRETAAPTLVGGLPKLPAPKKEEEKVVKVHIKVDAADGLVTETTTNDNSTSVDENADRMAGGGFTDIGRR